jgi:hypothetical protein
LEAFCDFYLLTVVIFKFLLELEFEEVFLLIAPFIILPSLLDYFLFELILRLVTSRPSFFFFKGSTEFSLDLRFMVFSL